MSLIPEDLISLPELVEMVVAKIHGQDAIDELEPDPQGHGIRIEYGEVTSFQDGKDSPILQQRAMYVFRAGKKILSTDDDQRWDGAREKIQTALSDGEIRAYILLKSGHLIRVPKKYWQGDDAWRVFETGNLEKPDDPEQEGQPVYVKPAAIVWAGVLTGPGGTEIEDKPRRGPRKRINYNVFETTVLALCKRMGDDWTKRRANQTIAKSAIAQMKNKADEDENQGNPDGLKKTAIPGKTTARSCVASMRASKRILPKE